MNNKSTTLNFKFESGKVILPIDGRAAVEAIKAISDEFKAIDMGPTVKVIEYKNSQYTIPQFESYIAKKLLTPAQREIMELRDRIELLESGERNMDSRLSKLENLLLSKSGKVKTSVRDTDKDQRALRSYHARIKNGEPKATQIDKILEIAGFKVAPLSETGHTAFGPAKPGEIRCPVYMEELFDNLGVDKFTEFVTAMSTIDDIQPRLIFFQALNYCLENSKMTSITAVLAAETYFKMDYPTLVEKLKKVATEQQQKTGQKLPMGLILGKIITGELKI